MSWLDTVHNRLIALVCGLSVERVSARMPDFNSYRWNEDYASLAAVEAVTGYQHIKYIPPGDQKDDVFVSPGGMLREGINVYNNDRSGLQGHERLWVLIRVSLSFGHFSAQELIDNAGGDDMAFFKTEMAFVFCRSAPGYFTSCNILGEDVYEYQVYCLTARERHR